ncbi:MAG: UDP-N-acetylglucosamine 4,6-dehydratase (inverting) [Chlamydiales bacterium]|nr:UDP-N-acetylglucosamine 4,6-dehydratase (inverting) [Chlamydiia bacterium]MCP5506968.1 UDP-N-acetylglucosamine 4,6-dehydratase (inverting) [Chlamydiales bacterium]
MTTAGVFKNKTVLITGGTGSFGKMFAKRLLEEDEVHKVIIFSRDEWKQWDMQRSDPIFSGSKVRYFLGDIRDLQRLRRAFGDVNYIVHAAALKQVPAAEYNPSEFVKTNVNGAMNIVEAAISCGVEKVIALSTDKACNPINLYGATKLCSDKLFVNGNVYVGTRGYPIFSVVRYGNVLNSRGSIIPLWRSRIQEGAKSLTITDPKMTRFWITLEHAVQVVVDSFDRMRGGEIYVPKIPSMRITDLAEAIAPGIKQEVIGIRPGEKLHEVLISVEDARHTYEFDDHYVIVPETYSTNKEQMAHFLAGRKGKIPTEGFAYTSDSNTDWLSIDQLREVIKPYFPS